MSSQITNDEQTQSASDADPVAENQARILPIFIVLILGMLMSSLGQMIFATALPTIVGDLGGVEMMSWVITAFLLAQTIALPISGKLGDMIGRKGLFLGGVAIFVAGSIVGAIAQDMSMLIIARTMQGLAAGTLMVTSQAITAEIIPARQRGRYMGYMGAVFGLSSVLGPILGGWFTDGPGWRWGLWVNLPIGAVTFLGAFFLLKLPKRGTSHNFDWLGSLFIILSASALILTSSWGGSQYDWDSPQIIGLIVLFLVSTPLFVWTERKAKNPLLPMSLFRSRNFVLATVGGLFLGVSMFGLLGYIPTYLQMSHVMTPSNAGLMMIPMMVGMLGTSITVGNIISRTGHYKWYPVIGMTIAAVTMIPLSTLHADDPLWLVGLMMFCFGLGIGLGMQVLVLVVQNSFPVAMVGTATAGNNFFRQIGGALGASLVGAVFTHNLTGKTADIAQALGASGGESAGPSSNLTPAVLASLPQDIQTMISAAYNDSFTPVFLMISPMLAVSAIILAFIREVPLKETVEDTKEASAIETAESI